MRVARVRRTRRTCRRALRAPLPTSPGRTRARSWSVGRARGPLHPCRLPTASSHDFRQRTLDAVPRAGRGGALARATRRPTRRRAVGRRPRRSRYAVRAPGCALAERASTLDQNDDDNGKNQRGRGVATQTTSSQRSNSAASSLSASRPGSGTPDGKGVTPERAREIRPSRPARSSTMPRALADDSSRGGEECARDARVSSRCVPLFTPTHAPDPTPPRPAQIWDVPK